MADLPATERLGVARGEPQVRRSRQLERVRKLDGTDIQAHAVYDCGRTWGHNDSWVNAVYRNIWVVCEHTQISARKDYHAKGKYTQSKDLYEAVECVLADLRKKSTSPHIVHLERIRHTL